MKGTLTGLVVLTAAFGLACGSDSNNDKICGPGTTQVCSCPGGTQGVQTCNITGESWSTCDCGSSKKDGGTGKVCIPGTTQACTCAGGLSGVHSCNQLGSGFDPCNCSTLDGGTVKVDTGGAPTKAVGKFCHVLVDKNTSGTLTITMKIGSGANEATLSAWSNACSTDVGIPCHQIPVGNNIPIEFWLQNQKVASGSVNVNPNEEWIFVLDMDSNGQALLTSGALKTGYTCQSFNPLK